MASYAVTDGLERLVVPAKVGLLLHVAKRVGKVWMRLQKLEPLEYFPVFKFARAEWRWPTAC